MALLCSAMRLYTFFPWGNLCLSTPQFSTPGKSVLACFMNVKGVSENLKCTLPVCSQGHWHFAFSHGFPVESLFILQGYCPVLKEEQHCPSRLLSLWWRRHSELDELHKPLVVYWPRASCLPPIILNFLTVRWDIGQLLYWRIQRSTFKIILGRINRVYVSNFDIPT